MDRAVWLRRSLWIALLGSLLQVAMVVTGHYVPAVAARFGLLGTLISLVAGVVFARSLTRGPGRGIGFLGGLVAGGGCALVGIALSVGLGDVPAMIVLFGTLASAVAGGLGGAAAVRRA
jgi:hypothetical protein